VDSPAVVLLVSFPVVPAEDPGPDSSVASLPVVVVEDALVVTGVVGSLLEPPVVESAFPTTVGSKQLGSTIVHSKPLARSIAVTTGR
jgi:hypothetical protein